MKGEYSIQFVSEVTGINSHTIRAWEKRYSAVVPFRNDNGRRLYSKEQVDRLKKLHDLVTLGSNISDIAYSNDEKLNELHETYVKKNTSPSDNKAKSKNSPIDLNTMLQNLLLALSFYKLDVISYELQKARDSLDLRGFALNVLSPLMQEVGAQCQTGKLSIAQEHALSALIKFHVGNILFNDCHHFKPSDVKIILTTPEGEIHEFGILIAALLCKHYQLPYYFLGVNLPVDSLVECINQIEVDIAILGVSKNMDYKNPGQVNSYIAELDRSCHKKTKIWVGGFSQLSKDIKSQRIENLPTLQTLDFELQKLS